VVLSDGYIWLEWLQTLETRVLGAFFKGILKVMVRDFWQHLEKPFFVLAPMADVTDAAFRRIVAKYGKPDVMFTEFVSADGLLSAGRKALERNLKYDDTERPIVAQVFTSSIDNMEKIAAYVSGLGFDGLDINMGCPDKSVEKQGAGAALMRNYSLAREIIKAAKRGAPRLPISVKTRLGYSGNEISEWLPVLLEAAPRVITIHARTRREMSKVPAHWDALKQAVGIRNGLKSETLIIGNGDVSDLEDARKKAGESGCDGVMLGRAVFGNPWLFAGKEFFRAKAVGRADKLQKQHTPTVQEKLAVLIEHASLFEKIFKGTKNFSVMKKHFSAYAAGFAGAKALRTKLMEVNSAREAQVLIDDFFRSQDN
jgi:nifR3 family TIM-barrel protein